MTALIVSILLLLNLNVLALRGAPVLYEPPIQQVRIEHTATQSIAAEVQQVVAVPRPVQLADVTQVRTYPPPQPAPYLPVLLPHAAPRAPPVLPTSL
ncbi:MAG: hypothetical protein GC134_00240 [Proteobacteria bacterium]|nr:hypothetical protein [Pseudomonadota bacterium]